MIFLAVRVSFPHVGEWFYKGGSIMNMKRWIIVVVVAVGFTTDRVEAGLIVFEDTSVFLNQVGPIEHVLLFRTDKTGTETFISGLLKTRSGDHFTDLVTFSSPTTTSPNNVLWGHFDGDDGGIGSAPTLFHPLRLDFTNPVTEVGFRNRGIQPGINVRYFAANDQMIGEVLGSVSSFVGASSTTPIAYLLIQENPPFAPPGTSQIPSYITALHLNTVPEPTSLTLLGIGAVSLFGYGWRRKRMVAV